MIPNHQFRLSKDALQEGISALAALQDMLYAQDRWVVVATAVIDTLAGLDLAYPHVDQEKLKEIANASNALMGSKHRGRLRDRAQQ
jgi:hypothetical protein